ncbi:MAG: hypothetical protein OEV44_15485, partial [Spirochaetota bacterium]|nr:hypothetical protein [Spirochaetota bacterium]
LIDINLCIAATNDKIINKNIVSDCNERNILCCSVTNPTESHFTFPAFFKNKDLLMSISTGGKSPLLAAKLKNVIQKEYSARYSNILECLAKFRKQYQQKIPAQHRKAVWEEITNLAITTNELPNFIESRIEELLNKYQKSY